MFRGLLAVILSTLSLSSRAEILGRDPDPTVHLDNGTFTGTLNGSVAKFLGIPFGQSTAGANRFNLPLAVPLYQGVQTATAYGPSCPQQSIINPNLLNGIIPPLVIDILLNTVFQLATPTSEDCLSVNVLVPATAKPGDNLPIVAWIYGGGFEFGGSSQNDGTAIVAGSIAVGKPIIYVSMNYRVSAWGFLASSEVKAAGLGNLGLHDQRLALKWIQKYIRNFGGDPTKVTLWGGSAGSISTCLQMLTNGGDNEGLFRGAIMESGAFLPAGDITNGQPVYDALVANAGCSGSTDTLACLRNVPQAVFQSAADQSSGVFSSTSLNLAYQPRVDGSFLTDTPYNLIHSGSIARIPFIAGHVDDEGTLFTLSLLNIGSDAQFRSYVHSNYFPSANQSSIDAIASAYPDDITQGSPFDTGILNAITPEYKRLAAFQGDWALQAPRRFLVSERAGEQNIWGYLNKRNKGTLILGSSHGSEVNQFYQSGELQDYLINFVNTLDPNIGSTLMNWPQYTEGSKNVLTLLDGLVPLTVTQDTYRAEAMELLTSLSREFPV